MDFSSLHAATESCLTWIGFGVVCGVSAKLLMPGRDPGGTFVTFTLGIGGALIGAASYSWVLGHRIKDMISPIGFTVAIAGALVLLFSHRLLSGRILRSHPVVVEQVIVPSPNFTRRRRRTPKFTDLD